VQTATPDVGATYDRQFWLAYLSSFLMATGVALLFRFADFVQLLGGTEYHLGWIVGLGMVGSLATRIALGSYIDAHGPKLIWLGSAALFAAVCVAHLFVTSCTSVTVYLLRILYCCAVAGFYGSSLTFVSTRVPAKRIAEMIGMIGTSGFLGSVCGTLLGDVLQSVLEQDATRIAVLFVTASVFGLLALPVAWLAIRNEAPPKPAPHDTSSLNVLRAHYSVAVFIVGIAIGLAINLPSVFLRPFAASLDIHRIGLFFVVYAVSAIVSRVLTRRWVELYGCRRILLLGLGGMAISLTLLLIVQMEWQLAIPAAAFGCFHAISFPAIVAAASAKFPARHRGLATLLVLASNDIGVLLGSPIAGGVVIASPVVGLPPYPTMFLMVASLLVIVGAGYAVASRAKAT
jgi:MFS family permease